MTLYTATQEFGPFSSYQPPTTVTVTPNSGTITLSSNAGDDETPIWQLYKNFDAGTPIEDLVFGLPLADAYYRFAVTGNATYQSRGLKR